MGIKEYNADAKMLMNHVLSKLNLIFNRYSDLDNYVK